jgi:predicted transcriptional regulator
MRNDNGISSHQIKAARALLDWSQDDLAKATILSVATIRKLELGHISPRHSTTHAIRQTLENAGLEFIQSDGVRRQQENVAIYQEMDGVASFLDDVYQTVKKQGGEVVVVVTPKNLPIVWTDADNQNVLERIVQSNNAATVKCILTEAFDMPFTVPRIECRSLSRHYVDPMPFYVYGDKYAIVTFEPKKLSNIIVIKSFVTAQASRRHFLSMWDKAMPVYSHLKSTANVAQLSAYR